MENIRTATGAWGLVLAGALMLAGAPAGAAVFVSGHGGYLAVGGDAQHGVGNPYHGGTGTSFEFGFDLKGPVSVSFEVGPSYRQPKDDVAATAILGDGSYKALTGNVRIRFDPIDDLQPYFLIGGGQSTFRVAYADTGQVFVINGVPQRLKDDTMTAWSGVIGFGFDAPLKGRLTWGLRGRYLLNRWRSVTGKGWGLLLPNGDAQVVDASLTLRL